MFYDSWVWKFLFKSLVGNVLNHPPPRLHRLLRNSFRHPLQWSRTWMSPLLSPKLPSPPKLLSRLWCRSLLLLALQFRQGSKPWGELSQNPRCKRISLCMGTQTQRSPKLVNYFFQKMQSTCGLEGSSNQTLRLGSFEWPITSETCTLTKRERARRRFCRSSRVAALTRTG